MTADADPPATALPGMYGLEQVDDASAELHRMYVATESVGSGLRRFHFEKALTSGTGARQRQ